MPDLTGLPIAITGASSGIGAATAIACARAGMPVALMARRADRLHELAERIRAAGGRADVFPGDVTDPADCSRLVEGAVAAFGSLYAVFANAGYGEEAASADMPEDRLRRMFEVNFFGTMNAVRPAVARMRERPAGGTRGHVLICASCLSKLGVPYHGAYCATKAAQDHVGRAMRIELGREGIAVSTVHPVGTSTEFFEQSERLSGTSRLVDRSSGRFMQPPETVAQAIVRRLRRGRGGEVWTRPSARIAFAAANMFPALTDRVLARMVDRRLAAADRRGL